MKNENNLARKNTVLLAAAALLLPRCAGVVLGGGKSGSSMSSPSASHHAAHREYIGRHPAGARAGGGHRHSVDTRGIDLAARHHQECLNATVPVVVYVAFRAKAPRRVAITISAHVAAWLPDETSGAASVAMAFGRRTRRYGKVETTRAYGRGIAEQKGRNAMDQEPSAERVRDGRGGPETEGHRPRRRRNGRPARQNDGAR